MSPELIIQVVTFIIGMGAFLLGMVGIARSLQLQKLITRKQQAGVKAKAMKADPEVSAAMRGLRKPLFWACLLAVCSVLAPAVSRLILA
ncbi:hypothetical protein [Pseudoxanthomonas sp.]|uniref:hypothetical protein n=1 Tax=Pseudoxanthomonas sp. TaxID=1871049 RepID=UPI00263912BE|nr:hypothetical protein [Pseudoxanthomonas sp.]WDS36763.1 MAG: hypothetical protein O8I58_02270 [Pseudoxanthomonas sp.]